MPKLVAEGVSEEQYNSAGSKFIEIPSGKGEIALECEITNFDWDTAGVSYKFEVTITEEGANQGKSDKISGGAQSHSIWSSKRYWEAATGSPMPMEKGHPAPDPAEIVGSRVLGLWRRKIGKKGGDPSGEDVVYTKLEDFLPLGAKVESLT